ncbi:MAG TPA: PhzF family phenazine biosynthesis protein [Cytophagaceae bacterium]|jgi:PhzF family phenazine biosynthesis protein
MKIPIFQVDAFTDLPFKGNPAAVCVLDEWLDGEVLQNIAKENNLSETAFLVKNQVGFDLRWFTPFTEIKLCGHATLASAHVLFEELGFSEDKIIFSTASGNLTVTKSSDFLTMDFPAISAQAALEKTQFEDILKIGLEEVIESEDGSLICVTANEATVKLYKPDFAEIRKINYWGIFLTAIGEQVDFVSRVFAPNMGIDEDPVTGSAHCSLAPCWSSRLGKTKLHARQVSERGGDVICELVNNRILLSGKAVLYLKGEIYIK